ncbi:MAG: creatininase family protein [Thermovirgaceae bacterium]|nr:creatininase family protein [Thermovirgaceae bacterium]
MPDNVLLERMTWPEVRKALDAGYTTAVFACGAIEQHGPHLPLFVDAEHGTRLAEEVARRLGKALVAPTIRVGCSEHHMAFPGTISLQRSTLESLCRDYCTSLARHGFLRICIISSHGGNMAPLADMLDRLRDAVGPQTQILAFCEIDDLIGTWKRVVGDACGLDDRVGGHADIAESSLMLILHPDLVHREEAVAGCLEPPTEALLERMFRDGLHSVAPNGILGDPRGMTVKIGQLCLDELADVLATFFRAESGARAADPES